MGRQACRCWAANVECLLLALVLVHVVTQCAGAGPADPGRGDVNRKAQSTTQNNKNALAENNEQSNAQNKESQSNKNQTDHEKPKEAQNQNSEQESNDVPASPPSASDAGKKNGGNKAGARNSSNKNDDKKVETDPKDVEMKNISCTKTADCAKYKDTACVQDSDGKNRCLCGNRKPPRNITFCRNIRRYAKFPCQNHSQCIDKAECVIASTNGTNSTRPHVAHPPESPTATVCWCEKGFYANVDNSQCLDELNLLKEEQNGKLIVLQSKLEMLREEQKEVENRLKHLESSGQDLLPSLTITALIAASMLVAH